jgi:serine/threonine protein kinase
LEQKAPLPHETSPEIFGRYLVFERLGAGGMATVHRARETGIAGFERVVALKRLLPHVAENADFVEMFIREASLASKLQHANVVQIYELGCVEGTYFISMEYIEGKSLSAVLREAARTTGGPPPLGVAVSLLIQLCEALHFAHSRTDETGEPLGLIHRDVSPSNLLIAQSGHLKVIDFGIARAHRHRDDSKMIKGKLPYLAPEALDGIPLDHRSDIFAVGAVAHELLTGARLFRGANDFQVMEAVRQHQVGPPSLLNPEVPPELDEMVLRALSKSRERRWVSCGELADELHHLCRRYRLDATNREVTTWIDRIFAPPPRARSASWEAVSSVASPLSVPLEAPRLPTPSAHAALDQSAEVARTTVRAPTMTSSVVPVTGFGAAYLSRPQPVSSRRIAGIAAAVIAAAAAAAVWSFSSGDEPGRAEVGGGELAVSVTPAEAKIVVGGLDPVHGSGTIELGEGIYTVQIASPGYQTWVGTVEIEAGERRAVNVALVPQGDQRSPPRISLQSEPAGMPIWLDGKELDERTPATLTVEPGAHHLAIRSGGEVLWSRDIEAETNHLYELSPVLESRRDRRRERDRERDRDRRRERDRERDGEGDRSREVAAAEEVRPEIERAAARPDHRAPSERRERRDRAPRKPPKERRLAGFAEALELPPPQPAATPAPARPAGPVTIFGADVKKIAGTMPRFRASHLEQLRGDASGALRVCIGTSGAVSSTRVLGRDLPAGIEGDLVGAVKRWRYRPHKEDGRAVPACFSVRYRVKKP